MIAVVEAVALAVVIVLFVGTTVGPLVRLGLAIRSRPAVPEARSHQIAAPSAGPSAGREGDDGPVGDRLGPVAEIENRIDASVGEKIRGLVGEHPGEAVDVLRRWMDGARS